MDSYLAVTRCRSFSRSRSDRSLAVIRLALLQLLGAYRSLAVAQIDLSRSLDSLFCSYLVHIILLRLLVTDRYLAVTRLESLSCSYSTQIILSQSLGSISRGHSTRSLAVTRCRSFSRSRSDRSLAVAWIDLSRSLDSLSCSYSPQIVLSQSLGSISRGHSTCSFAVTRYRSLSCGYSSQITLSQLLGSNRSLAVTRLESLESQSLGLLTSLEDDVIPRRHIHPWRFDCDVCRLTLHPWQLAPVVLNTVLTDRSRNHPGVRSLIGIRSMSMAARPRQFVYDTSSMAT
ncbi:hypothetical protein F2Q69_00024813 [Brassica cretica]|uniref:Uncharacterized protein n=1 Tax=Brassica cretica TaxID=69181 RepID=A0A8S9QHP2_BRACR|nr:hypothetical protein F2Q69_00024813 [Brassica cretica]